MTSAEAIRALVTHPAVMAMKRPVRDVMWRVKGVALRNPPLPTSIRSQLFVCLGNICRSPFAAVRAEGLLSAAGRADIRCASAGLRTTQAARPPAAAVEVASAQYGCAMDDHRPIQVTRDLLADFDVIVVMEAAQVRAMHEAFPDVASRVLLLSLLDPHASGGYERYNIADPFQKPRAEFLRCYDRIDRALGQLLTAVTTRHEGRPCA